jgi:hypothetical protein
MGRVAVAVVLIVCLLSVIALSGCLFGKKKAEEGDAPAGKSEAAGPTAGPAGPGAPKGPAAGPAAGPGAPKAATPAGPAGGLGKMGGAAPKGPGGLGAAPPPAAEVAPAGGKAPIGQAKAAKAAGDYDKALQLLAGASTQDAEAQWLKAWMLAEQGKTAEAAVAFGAFTTAAKPNDPRLAEAKAALARLAKAAGVGAATGAAAGGPPGLGGAKAPTGPGPK